jgi:hypothetical protein
MQKYTNSVTNINSGRPVPNASILVTDSLGALATIYSDNGTTTQVNPITTGADGEYSFYAANGRYTVAISANGFTGEAISDILLYDPAQGYLSGSATYDPANLADAAGVTTTVPVTGAALGDFACASFSNNLQGITLTAWVSAADTVSVRFQNESGGALDLASGTLRVRVSEI